MYKRILVPLDGSDLSQQALPYVRLLAPGLKARVELLRTIDPIPNSLAEPAVGGYEDMVAHGLRDATETLSSSTSITQPPHPEPLDPGARGRYLSQVEDSFRNQAQDYLKHIASSLVQAGLEVKTTVRVGDPSTCIIDEAEKEPSTLIAMSTHGRAGLARWVMGSVTSKIMQNVANPLLVVRPRGETSVEEAGLSSIIVPLDGSETAEQVLPDVIDLARAASLSILLVRVTPSAAEYFRYVGYPVESNIDLSKEVDEFAVDYLKRTANGLKQQGLSNVEEWLLHGNPAAAIVDLAREVPNSIVAMTTHGRSGVGRWVLGSVADHVVRHCGEPVLLLRARTDS